MSRHHSQNPHKHAKRRPLVFPQPAPGRRWAVLLLRLARLRVWWRGWRRAGLAMLCAALAGGAGWGCAPGASGKPAAGTTGGTNGITSGSLPVANWTSVEPVTPDDRFDPARIPDASRLLAGLRLVDANGRPQSIAHANAPIILAAYWCPHCQRTLVAFQHDPALIARHPILISTGFPRGTTLAEAVATTSKEEALLGLRGFRVLYLLDPAPAELLPSYPTVLLLRRGTWYRLTGEHSASVWHQLVSE